jgi:hypothetical protein
MLLHPPKALYGTSLMPCLSQHERKGMNLLRLDVSHHGINSKKVLRNYLHMLESHDHEDVKVN